MIIYIYIYICHYNFQKIPGSWRINPFRNPAYLCDARVAHEYTHACDSIYCTHGCPYLQDLLFVFEEIQSVPSTKHAKLLGRLIRYSIQIPSNTQKTTLLEWFPLTVHHGFRIGPVCDRKKICPKSASPKVKLVTSPWFEFHAYIIIVLVMKRYTKNNIVFVIKHGTHAVFRPCWEDTCPIMPHAWTQ